MRHQAPGWCNYSKQRKCGADFVYLSEGCGRTQAKINDTQYPTLDRYEVLQGTNPLTA